MLAFIDQIIAKLQFQRRLGTVPHLVDDFTRLAKFAGDDPESDILRSLKEFHQEGRLPGSAYIPINDLEVFRQLLERHGTIPQEYMHALNLLLASKRVIGQEHEGSPVVSLNPEYSG